MIAVGEFLMAAFYYYPIAGIALAIWACRDPSRVLTAIVSGRARAAAVEAYLAGCLAASLRKAPRTDFPSPLSHPVNGKFICLDEACSLVISKYWR